MMVVIFGKVYGWSYVDGVLSEKDVDLGTATG